MKNIVKLLLAFSLFSVIACADYEEGANDREDCLDNPNLPVCNDDEQQDEPAGTDTPSDNDI
jgi:hypothetical protein